MRPFFDSEHGPIHTFKDHHKSLPEAFDDEYFRHMQWAHFASGGAGGGMRWPNRKPHILTAGMHRAQRALADFLPLIDWTTFQRTNLNGNLTASDPRVHAFGCGDARQAVLWLLRNDSIGRDGMLERDREPLRLSIRVPGLAVGTYRVTAWDTCAGAPVSEFAIDAYDGSFDFQTPAIHADLAFAIRAT